MPLPNNDYDEWLRRLDRPSSTPDMKGHHLDNY